MRTTIGPVATIMATLPLRKGNPKLAGPPYDLDPGVVEMADEGVLETRHLERLDRLAKLYETIEADPEFTAHAGHDIDLENARSFDERRRDLFTSSTE